MMRRILFASAMFGLAVLIAGDAVAARVETFERESIVPANPYTGSPAMRCVSVVEKRKHTFKSKHRVVDQQCYPIRGGYGRPRPRYYNRY